MAESGKIAVVAALEREVWPLVKRWKRSRKTCDGREFEFFESERMIVLCGGIGAEPARRATEAIIRFYGQSSGPTLMISAGFAGALRRDMKVGQIVVPRTVIDGKDGCRADVGEGEGVLLTFGAVADSEQKAKLANAYAADAVDMEAAAVARGAEAHGIRFMACKAISDASDFSMPSTAAFVKANGQFRTVGFAVHVALRPWLWMSAMKLAKDTSLAARNLCERLATFTDLSSESAVSAAAIASVKS